MKLVRFGPAGQEKPGLISDDGALRDLSGVIADIDPEQLGDAALDKLRKLDASKLPVVDGAPRIGCPVAKVGKFLAIGLNYVDHAEEAGLAIPTEPVIFTKAISCIQGPNDPVMIPKDSVKTDWEIELGLVIGKRARYVGKAEALDYVAGYCLINDVSERSFQLERGPTWDKGKGCDTFGPIGPWLVTRDAVPDPQKLAMSLDVNGRRKQTGNTSKMIFGVAEIVSYVSEFITLMPGDVICTGTPPGVGMGAKPPVYLSPGDTMTLEIEGLGVQTQKVVAFER
jgi:2-keto-4-pentenoate hydratase/2-oxohepta-3-ene-1,7-dioic acid hydratase in catechol pathway